jgi:hypothetical protein
MLVLSNCSEVDRHTFLCREMPGERNFCAIGDLRQRSCSSVLTPRVCSQFCVIVSITYAPVPLLLYAVIAECLTFNFRIQPTGQCRF